MAEASTLLTQGGDVEFSNAQLEAFQELESIVWRYWGINPEIEDNMTKRARKSAWLPTVVFYGEFDQNHGTAEKKAQNRVSESVLEKGERDFGAGVRLTFNLSDLIYTSTELDIKSLGLKRSEKREQLSQNLLKAYIRYLRLKNSLTQEPGNARLDVIKLEMLEALATLNSLSGGAFSNMPNLQ